MRPWLARGWPRQQRRRLGGPCRCRRSRQKLGLHPEDARAPFGREHHNITGSRLIAEQLPRGEKYESQNKADHHVVLPAGSPIIPEQKPFEAADRTTHESSLARASLIPREEIPLPSVTAP